MKRLLMPFLLLAGCAHQLPVAIPTPSLGAVKSGIGQAQSQLRQVRSAAEQIGGHITEARSKANRIDAKATILLEHW